MSEALYTLRVFFDRKGCIKKPGMQKNLLLPPEIPGVPFEGIDYAPETQTYLIRREFGGWEEMTKREVTAVAKWLEKV